MKRKLIKELPLIIQSITPSYYRLINSKITGHILLFLFRFLGGVSIYFYGQSSDDTNVLRGMTTCSCDAFRSISALYFGVCSLVIALFFVFFKAHCKSGWL
jgi:hypothetical protein